MAVTLDALVNTEIGLQQTEQAKVSNGEAAKSKLQRLNAVISQLTTVQTGRDSSISAADKSIAGLGKVDSTALQASIKDALAKVKLDDAKLTAVVDAQPNPYADLATAAQAADADVLAKTVDAQEKWADVEAARRKVDIRKGALDAYVAMLTSASVTSQSLVGLSLDGTPTNLAQAWWQVQKSLDLVSFVTKAAQAKTLSDAIKAASDKYADVEDKALKADDALRAAQATQAQAYTDLGTGDAQTLVALIAKVKAASP